MLFPGRINGCRAGNGMQNGNREVYMDICAWSDAAFMVPKLIVTADTVFMYLF